MRRTDYAKKRGVQAFLKRFFHQEQGIVTVESLLVLPFLFWSVFATYTFYDSYRQSSRSIKAAFAVADVISRERNMINAVYIDTMFDLLEAIVSTRSPASMRLTFVEYLEDTKSHDVLWSCVRGTDYVVWTDANIKQIENRLPVMPDHGKMIIVETTNEYRAAFQNIGFGFGNFDMSNFVFTHPRVFDNIVATDPC